MPNKIAVVGLGWLGLPLAKSLHAKGYEIIGSTTRSEKLMRLLDSKLSVRILKIGRNNLVGDWTKFIQDVELLIINLPPGKNGTEVSDYPQQIAQLISRCEATLNVIFVSSTSVYGDESETVTEESATNPTRDAGKAVLEAENRIRAHFGKNATIVRFAGLIGENRHPGRFLKAGTSTYAAKRRVNLIDQTDCIRLIESIYDQRKFGEIYNGCADEHPTYDVFYTKAAKALGLDSPQFDSSQPSSGKIVSNEKSKLELGMSYGTLSQYFDQK